MSYEDQNDALLNLLIRIFLRLNNHRCSEDETHIFGIYENNLPTFRKSRGAAKKFIFSVSRNNLETFPLKKTIRATKEFTFSVCI